MELRELFTGKMNPGQKQYEAVRAVAFNEGTVSEIAAKYGYTKASLRTLIHRVKTGKQQLFPEVKPGPKGRQTKPETIEKIAELRRKKRMNSKEITAELNDANIDVSVRTVERILKDAGFPKLPRRTFQERGLTKQGT